MNWLQFLGSLELGLVYSLVAIGVYISFRILDFPDLTADGSFPMGAGIAAILIAGGWNPWVSCLVAMAGGAAAGLVTAWLNVRFKILHLLASILTMTALYSINLRIMGRPNVALLSEETIFTFFETMGGDPMSMRIWVIAFLTLTLTTLLWRFLMSHTGLAVRATGSNPRMARAQGIRTGAMIYLGIALSNALIALGGAVFAQSQGFADVTMGTGTIIVGLASVIIGEVLFPSRRLLVIVFACLIGSIAYRSVVALALNAGFMGLQASDLNLITAVIIAGAMILPRLRSAAVSRIRRRTDQ